MNRERRAPVTKDFIKENCTINPTSGCWEWKRNRDKDGYGKVRHLGALERVHRVSWQLWKGIILKGIQVLHDCDNPPCCNPEHLFTGNNLDNRRDSVRKGRHVHKLSQSQVLQIRNTPGTLKKVGEMFGVSKGAIHKIRKGIQPIQSSTAVDA